MGSGGTVVALLSGGIDSPVAAWRMLKRGCRVVFVHFADGMVFQDWEPRPLAGANSVTSTQFALGPNLAVARCPLRYPPMFPSLR